MKYSRTPRLSFPLAPAAGAPFAKHLGVARPGTEAPVNPSTPFAAYLREIDDTPLLNAAEERELAARVLTGDLRARDHLARANLRLVVCVARTHVGRGLPLEDLVSEGNMGLLRAVEGFDPTMNTRFSTYASYWIKQSIKRAIVNTAKTIRVPAYMAELLIKWRRATSQLTDDLGRPPTQEEVAKELGLSKKKLAIVKKAIRVASAGSQAEGGDAAWSLEDVLTDGHADTPDAEMGKSDDLKQVLALLDGMDPREATVLRMRFGLNDEEPQTLNAIGERLGLTRERVRQIENEALGKLSATFAAD